MKKEEIFPVYRKFTLEQLEELIKNDFPSRQGKEFRIYCSAKGIDKN